MDAVLFFLLLSFCGSSEGSGCPLNEDLTPCKCVHYQFFGWKIDIVCSNLLRPEELISPLRSIERSKTKVYKLQIKDSSLMYLPENLFENTHIEDVEFVDTEIMSLSESDTAFSGIEEIMSIIVAIRVNTVSHWNFDQLRNLKKLRYMRFCETHLDAVNHHLPYLPELKFLFITSSEVSYIADDAFSNLPKLLELSVRDNKIKEMKRNMLPNPANYLRLIDLDRNMLSYLPDDFFKNMPSLTRIRLEKNKFMSLAEKTFSVVLRNLEELDVGDNPIRCDCRMLWLVKIRFPPEFKGRCSAPKTLRGRNIDKLDINSLLCL